MSRENVEIARRHFSQIVGEVARFWEEPRSFADAAAAGDLAGDAAEVFARLHPDVRWTNLAGEIYVGPLACAKGVDALLQAAQAYEMRLDEVTDLGGERVLVVIDSKMKGQSSGAAGDVSLFAVVTLRAGLMFRAEEYLTRDEALTAAASAQ